MRRGAGNWRSGGHDGFTLIELLIVISTMVVLFALSTPLFMQWLGDTNATQGARHAYDILRQARNRAMRTSYQHKVRFEPASGRFETVQGSQAYRTPPAGWHTVVQDWVKVANGVEMRSGVDGSSSTPLEVKFNADGTAHLESPEGTPLPPDADSAVICLRGGSSGKLNKVVVSRCGRISLQ